MAVGRGWGEISTSTTFVDEQIRQVAVRTVNRRVLSAHSAALDDFGHTASRNRPPSGRSIGHDHIPRMTNRSKATRAKYMKLESLSIDGYRGVCPGRPLILSGLGHRNVFIGKNNSGKSTVLRFLSDLSSVVDPATIKTLGILSFAIDPDWFWLENEEFAIKADFTFLAGNQLKLQPVSLRPQNAAALVHDDRCRIRVEIFPSSGKAVDQSGRETSTGVVSPLVNFKEEWLPIHQSGHQGPEMLQEDGSYANVQRAGRSTTSEFTQMVIEQAQAIATEFGSWLTTLSFFDAVRSLERPSTRQDGVGGGFGRKPGWAKPQFLDGSRLMTELLEWQQDSRRSRQYAEFVDELQVDLNRVLGVRFRTPTVKNATAGSSVPDMKLQLDAPHSVPISFRSMGTGVSQAIILLAALRKDQLNGQADRVYCVEEPESNLHPTLLRRLFRRLKEVDGATFLVSTHSPVLINELAGDDRIYHFRQQEDGRCIASRCQELVEHHDVLDQLGVSGSDLLQTNCVVWVEGPSDRTYLREWLDAYRRQHDESSSPLVEGIDYSVVFYGGSLLRHYAIDDHTADDLIRMLRVSRFAAVIMDRDREPMKPAPQRILDEAANDPIRRFATVTTGKEVENDVPRAAFLTAAAARLGMKPALIANCLLPLEKRYPAAIADHLGLSGEERDKAIDKLENKVLLATKVREFASEADWQGSLPAYIKGLYELIRHSQGPD